MSTNQSYLNKLKEDLNGNISTLNWLFDADVSKTDLVITEASIKAAQSEFIKLCSMYPVIEEAYQVKALHDRVHAIVVSLRSVRNNLERLEAEADEALTTIKEISHAVETSTEDDYL
jgi:fructose-specific phosphotransferase system component IIB